MHRKPEFHRPPPVGSLIFRHFVAKIVPWLVALVAYLFVATAIVRWDMARHGEPLADFGFDLYGVYMQLFFEPTEVLPRAPFARLIFWITPLIGAGLLLRGIIRVGSSLFDVEERRKLWVKIMADQMRDHIIVCGLGHVGLRVVESLASLGAAVVGIERRPDESFAPTVGELGIPVLYGDARHDARLVEAGVRYAKAIVCATDDDLANLEIAIDARKENPKIRVVMRMFDQRMASKMREALDVDETFSTTALTGPIVALQATGPGVLGGYRLADGTLRVDMEIPAPKGWWGRTVSECEDAIDGRVIGVRKRNGEYFRPRHDTKLNEGDVVTLDLPAEHLPKLRASAV
jgi:Trk K+ transport system NAD-binding subunit